MTKYPQKVIMNIYHQNAITNEQLLMKNQYNYPKIF